MWQADPVVLSCDIKDFFMNIFLSEQRRHIVPLQTMKCCIVYGIPTSSSSVSIADNILDIAFAVIHIDIRLIQDAGTRC